MQIFETLNSFYTAVIVPYNICKHIKNPANMSAFDILNQPLFGNQII